jgi:hypothetical protein
MFTIKRKGGIAMEYDFYAEQKYYGDGKVEARVLTAGEAESLGYEDGYKGKKDGCTVYVDGFYSERAVRNFLSGLYNCITVD